MQANSIIRVVRPNLEFINQMRARDNQPGLGLCDRREAIRNIAVADDNQNMTRVVASVVSRRIGELLGVPASTARISDANYNLGIIVNPCVYTAVTGAETASIEEHMLNPRTRVDMLFTDFNLRGMTGDTIIRNLRKSGYNGYIIGMTAQPSVLAREQSNIRLFYGAGADLALEKPFGTETIEELFSDRSLSWLSERAQKYTRWPAGPEQASRLSIVHGFRPSVGFNPGLRTVKEIEYILSDPAFESYFTAEEIDALFKNEVLAKDRNIIGSTDQYLAKLEFWSHLINNKLAPVVSDLHEIEALLKSQVAPQLLQSALDEILPDMENNLRILKIIEDWIHHHADLLMRVIEEWKSRNPEGMP